VFLDGSEVTFNAAVTEAPASTRSSTVITLSVWIMLSFGVGVAARQRGRDNAMWFFISVVTSPVLGLLFLPVMPNLKAMALEEQRHAELLRALNGSTVEPEARSKVLQLQLDPRDRPAPRRAWFTKPIKTVASR
jgi:hypothetical protein